MDRWWSVHRPFNYRVRQSKSLAINIIAITWATTFILHIPIAGLYDVITVLVTPPNNTSGDDFQYLSREKHVGMDTTNVGSGHSDSLSCLKDKIKRHSELSVLVSCEVPYKNNLVFVVVLTIFRYLIPFLFLLILNLALYYKISERKTAKVRRSISGIDTVLFTLLKASSSDSECNGYGEDNNNDLSRMQRMERRSSRMSPVPLNRRHTMSQIVLPGMSYSPFMASSPRQSRPLKRRISLQDCLQSSGYSSSLQVPRRKSHVLKQSLSDSLLPVSRKQSRDDLVKDLLEKQDKKAACFLGSLQSVLFLCWTPLTVVSLFNAATQSRLLPHWVDSVSLWVLLGNSAINPFLYGLLNAEFNKVVKGWFKIKGSKRGRLKTALRRFSMHIAWELEKTHEATAFETVEE